MSDDNKSSSHRKTALAIVATAALAALGSAVVQEWIPALLKALRKPPLEDRPILWINAVKDSGQRPLPNVVISLWPASDEGARAPRFQDTTDRFGRVQFNQVEKDAFILEAVLESSGTRHTHAEPIFVKDLPSSDTLPSLERWLTEFEISALQSDSVVRTTETVEVSPAEVQRIRDAARRNGTLRWMSIALGELGVAEIPGEEDNERIIAYHAATDLAMKDEEVVWNSSFVNWVIAQAGLPGTRSAAAQSWLGWGRPLRTPQLGAITILRRGTSPLQGHVGFYVGTADDGRIRILGGNQGNRVAISVYSSDRLLGYRLP